MKIQFQPLTEKYDAAIAALIRTTLKAYGLDIPGTAYFDEALDHLSQYYAAPGRIYEVAWMDGQLIGGVGLAAFAGFPDCCEMQKLYLAEAARGRGLGDALARHIETKAREMGYRRVYLETHDSLQAAIRLYEARDYQQIERLDCVVHGTMNRFYLKELTPFSGPVSIPLGDESPLIQAAPAYDLEEAKRYIPSMPALWALADSIPANSGLTCFGLTRPSSGALHRLDTEIQRIVSDHHQLSFIMADLKTLSGVAFRPGVPMCSQSTIKAIYTGAVLNCFPEAFRENGQYIRDTIVLSSNEAYENMRSIYGQGPLRAWCREVGVDGRFTDIPYPRAYTARDIFKLWTRLYCFLNDGSDIYHAGRYFADSAMSAAKERFRGRFPVQTKAGWENGIGDDVEDYEHAVIPAWFTDGDPMNDECATNDTGVVYADHGPYLFAVYSDYPCPYLTSNRLYGVTDALYEIHASLQKG